MQKVFIVTECGRNIGLGHITRCLSLCQAFEEKGIMPRFIINGDDTADGLLKGKELENFNWLKEKKRLFSLLQNRDIAVIDSYLADFSFYNKISKIVKTPVYIDDNKRLDYPRGIVVNGSIYADRLGYSKRRDVTYLLGRRYALLRKEFREAPKRKIKKRVDSIMITFGGVDGKNMTPRILKLLNREYPEMAKNIVIGKGFRKITEIKKLKDKKSNLICNPDAGEMKAIMLKSDIAISAGGQTLCELARIGIPTIGVCVAKNQRENLQRWQRLGFIEYIGRHDDLSLISKVARTIERFFSQGERIKRGGIGRSLIDGKGAERTVKRILYRGI